MEEKEKASGKKTKQCAKKNGQQKQGKAPAQPQPKKSDVKDVSMVKFMVGKVLSVEPHPNPEVEKLWVEKIDVGEAEPRTICSGLRAYVKKEDFEGKLVLIVGNLKVRTMVGVPSNGMVVCASRRSETEDKVVLLTVPEGCTPGEVVTFEGYPNQAPDVMNPKHKIWETVAPDLHVNGEGVAMWKDVVFMTSHGPITSSLVDAVIS